MYMFSTSEDVDEVEYVLIHGEFIQVWYTNTLLVYVLSSAELCSCRDEISF